MGDPEQEISRGQQPDDTREPRLLVQQGAATIGQPAWLSNWTRGVELGVLAVSCVLLVWLNRGDRQPEPLYGAFLGPWWSFLAVVLAAWVAPGYVLCRFTPGPWQRSLPQLAAFSLGLGAAWLAAPAAVVLHAGGSIDVLAGVVTSQNGLLVAAYAAWRWRVRRPSETPPADVTPRASGWLAIAAVAALAHLLAVSARRPRFSFGSDEWILMRTIRYFLEVKPIAYTFDFDVWDFVIALLIRLARVDLIDAYRLYVPPVLIVAASLAFFALAESVFRDRTAACFSYIVMALYCLSDMHTRGSGAGMGLLVRIAEDKFAAWLVVVPLAQAAYLSFLRGGGTALAAVASALSLVAVVIYPLSLVWLALTVGATYAAALATGRLRARPRALAGLAAIAAAAGGLAWWLRSMRATPYFNLFDPDWPLNAVLRGLTRDQLLILSLEKGWYMAHPALLRHPLMIAAVLATLCLLREFPRSLRAQFLVCSTLVPVLVVYNPLTASLLGRWITPWMVHRVVWAVPVALTLGYTLHRALAAVQCRLGPGGIAASPARGRYAVAWLLVIGAMSALLSARMGESWRALKARNRVGVTDGERELMHALSRDRRVAGEVLAPTGIGIRLPAWNSRLRPYPSLDDRRVGVAHAGVLKESAAFYAATSIGEAEIALLKKRGIDYVITRTDTPVDQAIRELPGPFKDVYRGSSYSLYAWRPERWTAAAETR
jgi:hypothetical protein